MLRHLTMTLAAAASLTLAAATLTPALANYGHCDEQPSMADCRDYGVPGQDGATQGYGNARHAHQAPHIPAYRG
jgi:hypothetical protein